MGRRTTERSIENPETLEIAKLWETVYRALIIVGWQEIHRVARRCKADIAGIAEVHSVLRDRPVYYPAHIGGYCLIPNTKIINQARPSKLWQYTLKSKK